MPRPPTVKPYRWLAHFYDDFFSTARPPAAAARDRLLTPLLPAVTSACDLACGTGTTALALARAGIRTCAVDLSPTMCRLVREKAAAARLPVEVIRANMRDFRLPRPVDLVTCEFDAINHLPETEDLAAVARAVARALHPGGHFFFDVNNRLGFKRYWSGVFRDEKPGVILVMRNCHSPDAARAWSDVEWFVREGELWRRHTERVEEVCWPAKEIRRTLKDAGFDRIQSWDAAPFFPDSPIITRGCRTFYLARKSQRA